MAALPDLWMAPRQEEQEMIWDKVMGIFKGVTEIIKEPIKGWQERKTIKTKSDVAIAQTKADALLEQARAAVEMAKAGQVIEADWDTNAQKQMQFSWKDEFLMVLLFSPVVMLFGSAFLENIEFQNKIIGAVKALEQFPMWYVTMLLGIVAAVYGLRWLIAPIASKMMKGKP